jgi:hypothetical protein
MTGETDVNIEAEIAKLIALRQPARKPLSEWKKELDAGKPTGRRQLPTHR